MRRHLAALCAAIVLQPALLSTAADAGPAPSALTPTSVTVSGSSGHPLDAAINLIDRGPMSKWSGPNVPATAAAPQWAELTYPGPAAIGLVAVHYPQAFQSQPNSLADIPRTNGYQLHDLDVVAWSGSTQVAAQQITDHVPADDIVFRFVPPVTADKIRVTITRATRNGTPANAILGEITAYPPAATGPEQARMADSVVDMASVTTHWYHGDPTINDPAWTHFDTPFPNGEPSLMQRMIDAGIRHDRDELPGNPGINERTAAKFAKLGDAGIRSTIIMDSGLGVLPGAADDCPCPGYSTAPQLLEMVRDAQNPAVGASYAVEMVENPNETDARAGSWSYRGESFPSGTRRYNDALYDAVRANPDPQIASLPLLAGAMAFTPNYDTLGNLWPKCDAINFHQYPGDDVPDYSVDYGYGNGRGALSYAHPVCRNPETGTSAPVYPTETGYVTQVAPWSGVTPQAVAKYGPRMVFEYFTRGLKRTTFYQLIDGNQGAYGLLRNDGTATPAYTALKNMNTLLADPGPAFTPGSLDYTITGGSPLTLKHQLLQKRTGEFYLALWLNAVSTSTDAAGMRTDRDTSQQVTVTFNEAIDDAAVFVPRRGTAAVATHSDPTSLTLDVPDELMLVRLRPPAYTPPPPPPPVLHEATPAPTCSASASSTVDGAYGPASAFDGDQSTHWASFWVGTLPQWVQCDFNYSRTVNQVDVSTPDAAYRITELSVSTRLGGGEWVERQRLSGVNTRRSTLAFEPVLADAVRVTVHAHSSNGEPYYPGPVSISEVVISPRALTVSTPVVSPEPSEVGGTATAAASTAGGLGPLTCTIDHGDGSGTLAGEVTGGICTGPAHTYREPGEYFVEAVVRDAGQAVVRASSVHHVSPAPTPTTLSYTGQTQARGDTVDVSAVLADQSGLPLAGQQVEFTLLGTTVRATTDSSGAARATMAANDHGRSQTVTVHFAGTTAYAPSTTAATISWRGGKTPLG